MGVVVTLDFNRARPSRAPTVSQPENIAFSPPELATLERIVGTGVRDGLLSGFAVSEGVAEARFAMEYSPGGDALVTMTKYCENGGPVRYKCSIPGDTIADTINFSTAAAKAAGYVGEAVRRRVETSKLADRYISSLPPGKKAEAGAPLPSWTIV